MTSVVKVALARRFFCRAYTTDSPGQLSFKDRSGRGTRPIPRLDPVPRPMSSVATGIAYKQLILLVQTLMQR
ncbi:hypothetical protein LXEBMM8_EKPBGFGD_02522 [Lactiplantibacillus xiangfangensis]